MVCEEIATHQIETILAEREGHSIGHDRPVTLSQMRRKTIQIGNLQRDSMVPKLEPGFLRYLSQAGAHFQHGEVSLP